MTASVHLNRLHPQEIALWNAEHAAERTMDVAWLLPADVSPRQSVRLRFVGCELVDQSPVPRADQEKVLPLAVIPPLVNAHTHLEFSSLSQPIQPPFPFPDWIRSVIRWRLKQTKQYCDAIHTGLHECRRHGVAAVGEITTAEDTLDTLREGDTTVVSFRELIGLQPDSISAQLDIMKQHVRRVAAERDSAADNSPPLLAGISPHAPYSVHPDLFSAAVDSCRDQSLPVAMHLAETTDELELLDAGSGRFAEFLTERNLWNPDVLPRGRTILDYLRQLATLPRSLAVHCNYLTSEEIRFLGRNPQVTVVYCPRTHDWFGHADHPWREIHEAGGTVVLGTDGRGSNPDLSIWNEVRFLASRFRDCTIEELLPMVTTLPAAALGLQPRLNAGDQFNATLIQLPAAGDGTLHDLLATQAKPIGRLVSRGSIVQLLSAAQ